MLVSLGLQRVKIGEQNHGERAVLSFLSPLPRGWSRVGAVCAKPRVVTDAAGSAVGRGVGRAPRSRVLSNAGCIENEIGCAARPPSGTAKRSAGNSRSTPLTTPMPAHHPSHPPLRVPSLNRVRPRARPPVPTSGAGTVTDGHPQIVVPSGRERRAGADARIVKRSCQQVRAARLGRCSDSSRLSGKCAVSSGPAGSLRGMGARFIGLDREQVFLMPPSVRDWVPEGHLVWTVLEAVGELDLSAFYAEYRADGHGRPAYEPSMMVALLLYAYARGTRSARGIERACVEDVAFRVVTANQVPDHSTVQIGAVDDGRFVAVRVCAWHAVGARHRARVRGGRRVSGRDRQPGARSFDGSDRSRR